MVSLLHRTTIKERRKIEITRQKYNGLPYYTTINNNSTRFNILHSAITASFVQLNNCLLIWSPSFSSEIGNSVWLNLYECPTYAERKTDRETRNYDRSRGGVHLPGGLSPWLVGWYGTRWRTT